MPSLLMVIVVIVVSSKSSRQLDRVGNAWMLISHPRPVFRISLLEAMNLSQRECGLGGDGAVGWGGS